MIIAITVSSVRVTFCPVGGHIVTSSARATGHNGFVIRFRNMWKLTNLGTEAETL